VTRVFEIAVGEGDGHAVDVVRHGDRATVTIDGRRYHGSLRPSGDGYQLTLEDRTEPLWVLVSGDTLWVHAFGRAWQVGIVDPIERSRATGTSGDVASAPMPGTLIRVGVAAGDAVSAGQTLVIIESMKMESEITAVRDGVVERVFLDIGDTFDRGAALVALEPAPVDGQED
jgi:acetyl/propionyl-CoA carboxylase alpha subunit